MFSFVTVSFGVCWLPYHVYFIYSYHNPWVMTDCDESDANKTHNDVYNQIV